MPALSPTTRARLHQPTQAGHRHDFAGPWPCPCPGQSPTMGKAQRCADAGEKTSVRRTASSSVVRASKRGRPRTAQPDAHLVGYLNRISIIAGLIVCCLRLWLSGADPGRSRGDRYLRMRRPPWRSWVAAFTDLGGGLPYSMKGSLDGLPVRNIRWAFPAAGAVHRLGG